MNAYMQPGKVPVVEAAAIQGTGVTATLRAAVSRILDNLKNNVDTTLHEEPELTAPDMKAKAGVTTGSAGTPKLSMKTEPAAPPPKPAAAAPPAPVAVATPTAASPAPMPAAPFENAFGGGASPEPEEDPFGSVAVAEPSDDPFGEAAVIHDAAAERAEVEELLANTRGLIASLEAALERAKENERVLSAKLGRM
jgi:hypothetical protein